LSCRELRSGGLDHLRRAVHAQYAGARPAGRQHGGQVAGSAAQVGHEPRVVRADPAEQVEEWPGPLAAEPEVGAWIPHRARSFLSTSRYLTGPVYPDHSLDVKRYAARMDEHPGGPARRAALARDEVDDLVAAWHSERPDLDVEPLQVLSRVSRLARHLDRARRVAFARHGLDIWGFDVLSALRRQGAPYQLTPGALLRATLVTSGTMTNRIDRLAAADLVRREPDPSDKRGVLVTLTDQGRARVDAALAGLLRRERMLLAGLDAAERQRLADL